MIWESPISVRAEWRWDFLGGSVWQWLHDSHGKFVQFGIGFHHFSRCEFARSQGLVFLLVDLNGG